MQTTRPNSTGILAAQLRYGIKHGSVESSYKSLEIIMYLQTEFRVSLVTVQHHD